VLKVVPFQKKQNIFIKFLSIFIINNFDDKDASIFVKIKVQLEVQGKIISPMDLLIAAQAKL